MSSSLARYAVRNVTSKSNKSKQQSAATSVSYLLKICKCKIMKVRFLRLSIAILLQLAVGTHTTRTCSLVDSRTQAIFMPDASNCRKFLVCVHGVAISRYCPIGLHWNRVTNTCDYPVRAKCKILDSMEEKTKKKDIAMEPVQPLANGEFNSLCPIEDVPWKSVQLPYPENCTKFLKCSNGRVWILDCPRGLQWNVAKNRCDSPFNIKYLTTEIKETIKLTSLADLTSALGTTKTDLREKELIEDTKNEAYATASIQFRTSPLLREKLSEQSSTTSKIVQEIINNNVEQHRLYNTDVKNSIESIPPNRNFENQTLINESKNPNQVMQWTPTFLGEKTMQLFESTVPIEYIDILTTNSEEKNIISKPEDFWTENRHTVQPDTHITAIQETTNFTQDQKPEQFQENIIKPIMKTPEILTTQYNKTGIMKNERIDSSHKLIEEIVQPAKIVDYEDTTKTRKFKAVADTSLVLFGITTNRTFYMPLSKTPKDIHNSASNTTEGVDKLVESRKPQEKTAFANSSTESTTTTFDPRLPFKAVECEGIDNEERFPTTDCRKYYQCLNGYAYLLNCFDGYTFSAEHKICILADQCVA